ncbi:IS66 family transposase ISCARN22 [Neomoorella glycerini]|uniref:IS66 family transposase ISCARN22 n=1 Tax=Neomoorella glycerini TaxID=55779 RepID=A0A6I5ZU31_9FIRM|nr:Druantia anti-phage system protein DruA [Moorella glycerini]QGP93037.1 IS66 family transposase ISCARN22 [Moorella glycerini]
MDVPFSIGDREFTQADINLIRITVKEFFHLSREEIAATICENLPWKAPNGRLKMEACRKLLLELEQKGVITLPPLQKNKVRQVGGERLGTVIQTRLKAKLQEVAPVTIDPVTPLERADWNATMAAYHPLGYLRAIGAQQRYWIRVKGVRGREIVGAMLFGAAAKAVAARDKWIGWTAEERRRYRPRIVNNNRFLILPEVHIPHLASHSLSLVARRIRADWRERYGYEPVLLETFVEPEYQGTCYRAANWIKIGETAGRGRQDAFKQYAVTVKTIWVYPLVRDWRRRLVEPFPEPVEETLDEGGE